MSSRRATNILLLLIFLSLVVIIFTKLPIGEVSAETFLVDRCITETPYDKPGSYLHVITHDVAPVQSGSELIKEYGR